MVYSVLTEPVIPVLWPDGSCSSVGIREAFLKAHEIRDIQGDTPLERYALLRLLIAFSMDMLHPKNSSARRNLLEAGQFDADEFDEYIKLCEKDGPRFDLFNPEHPFMQSKYDEVLDAKAEKPVAAIIHSLPSGNNHVFLDHRFENTHILSFQKILGALCAAQLFSVSGLAGPGKPNLPSSVNNTPPLYISIIGHNLFETIVYNMLSLNEAGNYLCLGTVPWRNNDKIVPYDSYADISLLEGLTWQPRRLVFVPNENQTIKKIYCQAGKDFKGNDRWIDPFVPCKFNKKTNAYDNILPKLGRALWRDIGTLLYDNNNAINRQPQVIKCISNILDEDDMPHILHIRIVGLVTNKAQYVTWYEDELSLPLTLLENQEQSQVLNDDVQIIELIVNELYSTIKKIVDKPREKSKSEAHEIATQCQQYFLQKAHDLLFGTAMEEICSDMPEKEHVEHFCEEVKRMLQDTFNQVLRVSGFDAQSMMRQMEAERWIWSAFKKLTEERMKYYA